MCGITGWVSYGTDVRARPGVVEDMTEQLRDRGPDAGATWTDAHAALGHRRLAVIDVAGGAQPMVETTADGDVALTYSGEAYNFAALRSELAGRGHRFTTRSDTEVVLRGYLEWGAAVVDRLVGMYAFAVWDARDDTLLLVRDRLGVKPLYYYPTADGIVFGSEPKAILAHPDTVAAVGLDGMREIYSGIKRPGVAVFEGMRELRPGHTLRLDRSGRREHEYWALQAHRHDLDGPATVARTTELLEEIVDEQLVSDVPLCTLLSGGLDSSAITGIAAERGRAHGGTVRSFSVDFQGHTENFRADRHNTSADAPFVADAAAHMRTEHRDVVLDPSALSDPAVRRAAVEARDMPVGFGDMDMSLYLLFSSIRERSTVALSGEGADELFGGYWWFHDDAVTAAPAFPWLTATMGQARQERPYGPPDLVAALDIPGFAEQTFHDAVAAAPVHEDDSEVDRRWRQQLHLHMTYNMPSLLDRKDRMSMAVGLEVRVPFCDHRLAQLAYDIPRALHTADGREKSVLRAAVGRYLPASILARTKSPYPRSQNQGYVIKVQDQVREALDTGDARLGELIHRGWASSVATRPAEEVDPGSRMAIERLLDFQIWLEQHDPELRLA
ncbi:asparagine synthase (glutamine-hydrolyzing) [Actinomycetospora aeridis]|uniref:asparagine synthase (glutamine-hydrolyzing) n=1 Tax=Actinomycetospora aeridis TaxID=3129231 RepID=A0ABU8NAU2_9PSEU